MQNSARDQEAESTVGRRPLEGLLVLDLTQMASGPYATMLLADAGANVVKIERPGSGDPSRGLPPFRFDGAGNSVGAGILRFGRNKRSLALNLSSEAGKAVFLKLVKKADVLWENFVPGTMDRLGLSYSALSAINPGLVYATISGFGNGETPERDRAALDVVAQAESGLMEVTGEADGPPAMVGAVVGDLVPALYGVIGTLLALSQRASTGKGAFIDVAMVDSLFALNERAVLAHLLVGEPLVTRGRLGHAGPYGRFSAKDGYLVIGASIPSLWQRLAKVIGREDLLEQAPAPDAEGVWWRFWEVMRPAVTEWVAQRTCEAALELLHKQSVPAARVATVKEAAASAHIEARHMILEGSHPVAGSFGVVGSPIKISGVPEPEARPVPLLGEHSDDVLRELLGYDEAQLASLRVQGAIA